MNTEAKQARRLLFIDSDVTILSTFGKELEQCGYRVELACDGDEARTIIKGGNFDVVILDVCLRKENGFDLVSHIKEANPGVEVILFTGQNKSIDYLEAVETGVSDWLAKPCRHEELLAKVTRIRERQNHFRKMETKNRELEKIRSEMEQVIDGLKGMVNAGSNGAARLQKVHATDLPRIIGNSRDIEKAVELTRLVADTTSTVLIAGESGTGKELFARAVHDLSPRSPLPFISVNCSALPDTLLESELFGHKKGAFTGAVMTKRGLIEEADGGTLFLDEIGEMSAVFQSKLLRTLQDGEFRRVGSSQVQTADVRVVVATNRNLEQRVSQGLFREDLYYRINQFQIGLPPLRERIEDLPLLAHYFLEQASMEYERPLVGFSSAVMEKMFRYAWPGNIRELKNMIFQAAILATPPLIELTNMTTLMEKLHRHPRKSRLIDQPYTVAKQEFETRYFKSLLDRAKGNISEASRLSKVDRKHIRTKVRNLGFSDYTTA